MSKEPTKSIYKTKKSYIQKLKYLEKLSNKPIETLMTSPNTGLSVIKKKISLEPGTIAAYITPICKLFSISPTFKEANQSHYQEWSKYLSHYNKKRLKMYDEIGLSSKQRENLLTIKDVEDKFLELQKQEITSSDIKKHLQYILLAMLLKIRPKRCDLGNVYVSTDGLIPKSYADKNYIMLTGIQPRLVLNVYKTVKQHGQIIEPLPEDLIKILKESFELFPRKHLFISSDPRLKNKPYDKNDSYSKFVFNVFEKLFNKHVGASLWRHIFISENIDFTNSRYPDLVNNARLSGHTLNTQMQIYKIHAPKT